ncbi:glycosyltransferase [Priestia sp. TRN 1309]|uniref:glycosyltransferase n=1 Tax=Priestia sp. TRN 1309 TaxID=3420729 RepID=UPI003D77DC53
MENRKRVSIYVRNKDITPSSYYRIIQYAKNFEGDIKIRNIAPTKLYKKHLNSAMTTKINRVILALLYYICMLTRVTYYLLIDMKEKPNYIIVSKTFCPRYTPFFLSALIRKVTANSILYWDFDDYIFESGEISSKQASILKENSKAIVVTSDFLKSKINDEYHDKVILLPTTDGDMQGFDKKALRDLRHSTFKDEIRLVWVATAGNIPHLMKIIKVLDEAAFKVKSKYHKKLILTVVCNQPLDTQVKYLIINNIVWTRDRAKKEIYNSHIGIMPLIFKEYALGKGGFKLVQYISTGLPVIASKVGFNQEVVNQDCGVLVEDKNANDNWIDAIMQIAANLDTWENYSDNASKQWNEKFSYNNNLMVWNNLLNM